MFLKYFYERWKKILRKLKRSEYFENTFQNFIYPCFWKFFGKMDKYYYKL